LARRPLAVRAHPLGVEALAQALLAELVVQLALLGVAQDVVRPVHVLEAALGRRVAGVLVRMELPGKLAVCLLDGARFGVLGNAEDGVKVVGHRYRAPDVSRHARCGNANRRDPGARALLSGLWPRLAAGPVANGRGFGAG